MIKKNLGLLGVSVIDKVTGFKGIVTSVSFDLYGCVQAIVNPGMNEKGELGTQAWFDINRLQITNPNPIMKRPNFEKEIEDLPGPETKPIQKV